MMSPKHLVMKAIGASVYETQTEKHFLKSLHGFTVANLPGHTQVLLCSSVQFSRSAVSDSLQPHGNYSMQGLPVHYQPPEFTQTHVH